MIDLTKMVSQLITLSLATWTLGYAEDGRTYPNSTQTKGVESSASITAKLFGQDYKPNRRITSQRSEAKSGKSIFNFDCTQRYIDLLADSCYEGIIYYTSRSRWLEARELLKTSRASFPQRSRSWNVLESDCSLLLGEGANVIEMLIRGNKALTAKERYRLGLAYAINGQTGMSLDLDPSHCYNRFTISPKEDNILLLDTQNDLAAAWCLGIAIDEDISNHDLLACRYFELAQKYNPSNSVIRLYYALNLSKQGRTSEAVDKLQQSIEGLKPALRAKAQIVLKDYKQGLLQHKSSNNRSVD